MVGLRLTLPLLLLLGCEPERPATPPPTPPPATPAPPATRVRPPPLPVAPPAPSEPGLKLAPLDPATDPLGGQLPPQQPEGVPFPIDDPPPPECVPHTPSQAPGLQAGPDPMLGWLGGSGSKDGELTYPRALATAPDGSLYVVDKTGRIQKWDAAGKTVLAVVRTPAIVQGKPTGMSVAPDGKLLVADTHYCRVLVYSPELRLERAFGAPGSKPGHFLLVTDAVQGTDGRLYATDYGDYEARLQVFAPDGTHLVASGKFGTGEGELRRPMAICVDDARDTVYVADAVNHRIAIFGRDGRWRGALGGPESDLLRFPYSVNQDAQGRLWVAEFGAHRVCVLDPASGALIARWGQVGRSLGSLWHPWGLALSGEDRVWVLDSGNDRVLLLPREAVLAKGPG